MNRVLAVLAALLVALGLSVRAADAPPAPPADGELQKTKQAAAFEQERLRRQFSEFQQRLLGLAQRYEKSSKPEERERAVVLKQALEMAAKEGVDNQFNKLVVTLTTSGVTIGEINSALGQNEQLTRTLREMIAVLLTDNQTAKLKEEQRRLQEILKQLERVIREQKLERSKTESGRLDKDELAKGQGKVTNDTRKLVKAMGKGDSKDGKNGKADPKDPKDNQGKPKDPKDGKPDGKDPKENQSKPKDGQGEPKDAQGKPKDGQPKDGKPQDGKPQDGKPQDGKPQDGKPKDGQPKDGKPQDGKPQDGKPQDSQGQPQDGQQGEPKDGQQQPQQDQGEEAPGRKQVQDAIENQKNAEDKLKKNDRQKASGEQDEAIKKLEEVRKEIERRLKQMREEELERLLANLENRCARMLAMQIEVYDGTKRLHATVQQNEGQKASRAEDLKAGELSAREGQIVTEANKAIQLLEEDGTAVAIPQVLEQAREDMRSVQGRLFNTDVGPFTQQIEEEIIAALKEVIEALKKAQQDLKDKKDQPPPPPSSGGKPPDRKLIDMLAELKMIRSLQMRVNQRTTAYGQQYPGEQADDPGIQKELRGLSQRQVKIEKATKDIATGKVGGQ